MSINAFMIFTLVCIVRFPMFGDETWEKTPQHAVLSLEHHPGVEDHHKGHQDVGHEESSLRITIRVIKMLGMRISIKISMRITLKITMKISLQNSMRSP